MPTEYKTLTHFRIEVAANPFSISFRILIIFSISTIRLTTGQYGISSFLMYLKITFLNGN